MVQHLNDADFAMDPTTVAIAKALGCLGDCTRLALAGHRAASKLVNDDWCNDEIQTALAKAISRIEASEAES
jgi:hypothetical protein